MTTSPLANLVDQQRSGQASANKKDLYSSGAGEIFTKNFLAGFARALGTVVVYLIFIASLSFIISRSLLPQLQTLIGNYTTTLTPLLNQSALPNQQISPQQLQQLLNQLNK